MRRVPAAVGATLTASALLFGPQLQNATAALAQTGPATAALRYLYTQVGGDGSVAGSVGTTEDVVISTADSGYDAGTLRGSSGTTAYAYLSGQAASITSAGGAAKYALAWVAAGRPAAIDASILLSELNSTAAGGLLTSKGTFHNSTSESANAYSQSLALLADVAAGHAVPAHATAWLRCAQRADGGFGYAINDSAATPPAPSLTVANGSCGDTSSDTNDTAVILQALGAAGVNTATAAALVYLHAAQQPDGGFGFAVAQPSDPGSDTAVIQALVAVGQDPTGPAWTVGGHNPISNLETFADPLGSGGYVQPGNAGPDAFTTAPVPQALALRPYGAPTTVRAGTSPPAAVVATPTATPAGGVAAAATASPAVPATGVPGADPRLGLVLVGGGLAAVAAVRRRSGRPLLPYRRRGSSSTARSMASSFSVSHRIRRRI